ncbi:hypothetical protein [Segatella maculosa]|uniref:hypothetical protein n=1 Tax=Segatella maculosa TaxID=439703 RepID=UPI0004709C47|nr:hypothetical protein [Segatella maculosa]
MKTYVITLSKYFLAMHKRAGEETNFKEKFLNGEKIHTIRANYPLWEKRIKEVQEGRAVLSVRQWTGKPYRSKQVEITTLTAEDEIGVQAARIVAGIYLKIIFGENFEHYFVSEEERTLLAKNDGLSLEDWKEWFRSYDITNPLAIIHFTKFRY